MSLHYRFRCPLCRGEVLSPTSEASKCVPCDRVMFEVGMIQRDAGSEDTSKQFLSIDQTAEFHNTKWGHWNQTEGARRTRLPDSHPDYREPISKSSDQFHKLYETGTLNG